MAEPKVPARFDTLAVIGNGIIGHGVAQVFAMAGKKVVLVGRASDSLERAGKRIRASLDDFVAHELMPAGQVEAVMRRITPTTRLEDAAAAELVIEAVTEDLALKRDLFGRLDRICPPPAVLASSSGQPASALIDQVTTPERVVAAHFWYPPQLIPLVEICGGPQTAPEVVAFTAAAIREAGKEPVIINREIAGFIGNRLQFAMLREAWALWASGAASAEAIDAVVRNSFGRRVAITGPLESADVGGLATMYHFGRSLMPDLDRSPEPAEAVAKLVQDGAGGLANRRGVHDWTTRDGEALLKARMEELFRWLKHDRARP
jgi:3-hydroxybutyryl-CoA dehydrogenase